MDYMICVGEGNNTWPYRSPVRYRRALTWFVRMFFYRCSSPVKQLYGCHYEAEDRLGSCLVAAPAGGRRARFARAGTIFMPRQAVSHHIIKVIVPSHTDEKSTDCALQCQC